MKSVLGISAYYHDSAATLILDGKIVAAAQEERFTRIKHDNSFPINSIKFVLNFSQLDLNEVDYIVFYEKPFLKFERLLETYLAFAPKGFKSFCLAMPLWIKEKLFQKKLIIDSLKILDNKFQSDGKIFFSSHHLSHASSAFFPSPFKEAIVLTADAVGEWTTTSIAIGKNNSLKIKKEINFPHSLGLLYSSFTYYLGFKVNSGEYKLMGLAPYGVPKYVDKINLLIDIKEDGSFRLDQSYFNYTTGLTMTNEKFHNLFGQKPRNSKSEELNQFHMDIAASIQKVTENIIIKIAKSIKKEYGIDNLCLAGGVALNCVANGKLIEERIFKNIWVQPAAGDAGGSLGAALAFWYLHKKNTRRVSNSDEMSGSYLGPAYSQNSIETELKKVGAIFKVFDDQKLLEKTANQLSNNKIIGWFQGRMEFGPRALGNRSIIGDPRSLSMQRDLNLKIKFRESFRPFAPAIIESEVAEWFELKTQSPYMMFVSKIKREKQISINDKETKLSGLQKLSIKRSEIPAVTHVDYSARIQTVNKKTNKKFFDLLKNFEEKTKCPILINTSFNVRGEPIVNTPLDAYNCFMGTNIDILVIGNCFLEKSNQQKTSKNNYKDSFQND